MSPTPGKHFFVSILATLVSATLTSAAEIHVSDPDALAAAMRKVSKGDTIILQDGVWADARLLVRAHGTAEKPITIKAQTPGRVILTGDSRIAVAGEYIVVDGLWFQDPAGTESIVLRTGVRELGNDCRITNCAVLNDLPAAENKDSSRFISVYGSRHRIDHCYLAGKTTEGPTVVVWLAEGHEAAHRIDHNHFGPRQRLGRNGGETIRVGDSKTSMLSAACVLEHNLFEKCDGEAECISNKSCGNVYRHNRFSGVSGTLTLRHGNGCRVEHNVFLGDGARGAGGVRVIGEDHVITGNHFEDLTGDDERSAMCFMLGVPNSPVNLYFQVKRATVSGNTFLNCKHNILIGMKGDRNATLPPLETSIVNNFVQTNRAEAFEINCDLSGVTMKDNQTGRTRPDSITPPAAPETAGPTWRN
ncbi:MAG: hypothetical protein GY903_09545 [Fuerstiella sp.]|nr:hypothetical protein [Fuerstiella sp.]